MHFLKPNILPQIFEHKVDKKPLKWVIASTDEMTYITGMQEKGWELVTVLVTLYANNYVYYWRRLKQ